MNMTNGRQTLLALLAVSAVFVAGFIAGTRGESRATLLLTDEEIPVGADFDPVWKAWRLLDEKYVPATSTGVVATQDKVWGLISGLADSYGDPYTVFLPPQQSKSFEEEISGEFGGIGVEMGMRENILTVIAPLKGTPADKAGVRTGDLIIKVDDTPTNDMTVDDAVELIRGEVGTEVVLTIARKGEDEFLEIPIVRDIIEVPTLDTEVVGDDVFILSLYNFGGTATREVRSALRTFVMGNYDRLIIDLRGNPGGYLSAAVDIASWFLPLGKIVVTEQYRPDEEPSHHRSKGNNITEDAWRIAILVDGGSASASEILAGALREHGKAVLIGTQTFGKGSVQELVEVTPDTSIKITVARWLTPNGVSISEAGLTPDLVIEYPPNDTEGGQDPQMDAALHYVRTGELVAPPQPEINEGQGEALEVKKKVE
jgi:carboxyl-terminal processing protease